MNTHKIFSIKTRAVGYKSVDQIKIFVTYHLVDVANDFLPDLLGDVKTVVVFTQFELMDTKQRDLITAEFSEYAEHLQGLVKEVILFGTPYQGYFVQEAA